MQRHNTGIGYEGEEMLDATVFHRDRLYPHPVVLLCNCASLGLPGTFHLRAKSQLEKIQTVLIEAIASRTKAYGLRLSGNAAAERLKEVGYQVILDHIQPHDVLFRIKCEQHKTWEAPRVREEMPIS